MNQLVTFSHLPSLSRDEFLTIWRDSHGPLACEVQSTFGYRQHLIARKLAPDAQDHSAIVEEHFPAAAMDSPNAFYDAVGDDEKLQKHVKMMMASCTRFIDFDSINTAHMSEYTIRAWQYNAAKYFKPLSIWCRQILLIPMPITGLYAK